MSDINQIAFLAVSVGILALLIAVYVSVAVLVRMRKRKKGGTTEVGFVVDTFHELVAKLKEKERELEVLRKRAEEKAYMIEDYNENILQSVPSGVVSLDDSLRVVKLNASAERILEIRAVEVIGKDCREVLRGFPLEGGRGGQTEYATVSGRRLWLAYSITPLLDAGKSVIGQLLVVTDITELRILEAQAELRKRLSSLGEMAAGIAHELRNPMGVISGYMRLLSNNVDPSLNGTVEAVSKEVAVMDRIINDFLSFARPLSLECSEVALPELVRECVEGIAGGRDDVKVEVDVEPGLSVMADEVLLRQAFTNLIRNSLEALEGEGDIRVRARSEGEMVEVAFSDTGPGVPEAIGEKIFLPFYTTKEKGTGFGLAIVHSIITSHSGSVDVESGEGGTTFRVRLPSGSRGD
jgi:signal transduction histidine kinase